MESNEHVQEQSSLENQNDGDETTNKKLVIHDEEVRKLQFRSIDEAELFYKTYGKKMGFRSRISHTTNPEGVVLIKHWECVCAGSRKAYPAGRLRTRKETPNLRCTCPAEFRVSRNSKSGLYNVIFFESSHNHNLLDPKKHAQLLEDSSLSECDKALLTLMRNAGIRPCQSMNFVEQTKGDTGQLLTRKKKMYNYLGKDRVETMRVGDINIEMNLLEGMKMKDPSMMFESTIDKDGKLNRLFWCDGFSKRAYNCFSDVLICDSTYKTNTYRFPLVILSGIDNHFKCTIFGAALLQNETIESYEWLFKTFVQAMGGKSPHVVVTDQDEAMRVAIKLAFPEAIHRLCSWHLSNNCLSHVKADGFVKIFGKLVKKRCTVEEFENQWLLETEKYGVTNNRWVKSTYAKREMWSDAYLRGHFVGMTRTTQRAESMNFVFKQQGKAGSTITELLKHFQQVLKKMRKSFCERQQKSETLPPTNKRRAPLQQLYNSLASVYTQSVMDRVEIEIAREQAFIIADKEVLDPNGITRFELRKYGVDSTKKWMVNVNVDKGTFVCECNMLEADGLPCRHLFTVFKNMNILKIPANFIHERWSTEVGRELAAKFVDNSESGDQELQRFMKLNKECNSLCLKASQSEPDTVKSMRQVRKAADDIITEGPNNKKRKLGGNEKLKHTNYGIRDPERIPTRGAPPRKAQHCSKCGLPGHKSGTCKNKARSMDARLQVKSRRKKGIDMHADDIPMDDADLQDDDAASVEI